VCASLVATLFPFLFPASVRANGGSVAVYFEPAAEITALVLLEQILELRAQSQTRSAIRASVTVAPMRLTAAKSTLKLLTSIRSDLADAKSGNRVQGTVTVPERKLDVRNGFSEASLPQRFSPLNGSVSRS